jgi:adenylate cyclase
VQIANDYFRGVGAFVLKKHLQAKSSLQRGLLTLRVTKVAMDFEVDLLAATADVHWALRDFAAARRAALETLQVARQRNHRVGECRAALMLARLGSEREGVESPSWLEQADTLIRQTGAAYLQPALRAAQARARLSAPAAAAE